MNEQGKGCVFLVGAGCGARDLITLRGLDLLRKCDAVVYDALIDPALVDEAGTLCAIRSTSPKTKDGDEEFTFIFDDEF